MYSTASNIGVVHQMASFDSGPADLNSDARDDSSSLSLSQVHSDQLHIDLSVLEALESSLASTATDPCSLGSHEVSLAKIPAKQAGRGVRSKRNGILLATQKEDPAATHLQQGRPDGAHVVVRYQQEGQPPSLHQLLPLPDGQGHLRARHWD